MAERPPLLEVLTAYWKEISFIVAGLVSISMIQKDTKSNTTGLSATRAQVAVIQDRVEDIKLHQAVTDSKVDSLQKVSEEMRSDVKRLLSRGYSCEKNDKLMGDLAKIISDQTRKKRGIF